LGNEKSEKKGIFSVEGKPHSKRGEGSWGRGRRQKGRARLKRGKGGPQLVSGIGREP